MAEVISFPNKTNVVNRDVSSFHTEAAEQTCDTVYETSTSVFRVVDKIIGCGESWKNWWFRKKITPFDIEYSNTIVSLGPEVCLELLDYMKSKSYRILAANPYKRTREENLGAFSLGRIPFKWEIADEIQGKKLYLDLF